MKKNLLCLATFFCFSIITAQATAANGVKAIPLVDRIEYSDMLFGQFIEHFHTQIYGGIFDPGSELSDESGFRTDVIEALREIKVPIVRWPGGCFVSSYHWLDGVGRERYPIFDKTWRVEDPNTFGTDEFVAWCRKVGAEPYICTNAGTGTPEEMSDWVEYCNLDAGKFARMRQENGHREPFDVKYWSVGNENWGGFELGAKTVGEWGPFVRESSKLMRAVSPDAKLFAAATPDRGWTLPLLQAAGQWLDYISIHCYWDGLHAVNNVSPYMACMMRTEGPQQNIEQTINVLDESGYRGRIKIAFDEWNLRGWHHPWHGDFRRQMDIEAREKNDINATYTMADALFSACFLNACLRNAQDVEIACFSPIVNTRGAVFVHPRGIVKRTTFHTFKMYANMLEKYVVPLEQSVERLEDGGASTPVLDVVLTGNEAGMRYVYAVVNKHPEKEIALTLDFEGLGKKVPKKLKGTVLSGSGPDDYNDIGAEERVVPYENTFAVKDGAVSLPPHSLVFLTVE